MAYVLMQMLALEVCFYWSFLFAALSVFANVPVKVKNKKLNSDLYELP